MTLLVCAREFDLYHNAARPRGGFRTALIVRKRWTRAELISTMFERGDISQVESENAGRGNDTGRGAKRGNAGP
jgi:hypothetical protein